MEQNRNKPTAIWLINLWPSRKEYPKGKGQPLQQMGWENWTAACKRKKLDCLLTP